MTKTLLEYIEEAELESTSNSVESGDDFVLELAEDAALETYVIESWEDSILLAADAVALKMLESYGCEFEDKEDVAEGLQQTLRKVVPGYAKREIDKKMDAGKFGKTDADKDANFHRYKKIQDKLKETEEVDEAEYQGRNVPLGKPMKGDVKKSKVYVKKPNGKIVKVNFGDKKLSIKKHIPGRRKNFRARHNCDNPGPRWKARYWSCRAW